MSSQQGYETSDSTWLNDLADWLEKRTYSSPDPNQLYKWTPKRLREIAKILKEKIECDIVPEDNGEWFCKTHQKRIAMIIPKDCRTDCELGDDRLKIGQWHMDVSNHHNALECPYCNPKGLKFDETSSKVCIEEINGESCGLIESNPIHHSGLFAWMHKFKSE